MVKRSPIIFCLLMLGIINPTFAKEKPSDKNLAVAPYVNDLGLSTIDVSSYPVALQNTYKGAFQKCAKCHSLARPINSQFVELSEKEITKLKKSHPKILKDTNVLRAETGIWKRYVKRMMAKPGCEIKSKQGKAIWQFLVYDSKQRKVGKNLESWVKHRKELLADFKEEYPERYEILYGENKE